MIRKFGLRKAATNPQAKAISKLDKAFSELVRQHYEKLGCFTCGVLHPWKEMDNGHFRRRECKNTRFDPRNVGIQCKKCNRFDGGRSYEMGKKLDELWGEGTAAEMQIKARIAKNWDVKELEQLIGAAKLGWIPYLQLYREINP